jgi:hypothetical protein
MSIVLTAAQVAEVDAFIRKNAAWERKVVAGWNLRPSGYERHRSAVDQRKADVKAALAVKRRAAKLARSPAWADQEAITAVYASARRLTAETGVEHHVDHFYPLQGKNVSGLHVAGNLRIITAAHNLRKGNRFEVEA